MRIISTFFLLLLISSSLMVSATLASMSPYIVLEDVGSKLFSRIASNQQEIKKFPELMRIIVDEELMPSIDYKYAAYRVLGKNLRKVSKEQRNKFVQSMRHNLVRTYATALIKYKNQRVIFESDKPIKDKKIIAIRAQIVEMNKPTIDIVFKMRLNKKTGEWKAFDMVVEGISLLSSKEAELGKRITQYGVEQVTLELLALRK